MEYHFRNLVFEGGGVKGIAYVGAMEELQNRSILQNITRVGGTSAGAINAVLVGLGYTLEETRAKLWELDFNKLMDCSPGFIRNIVRLVRQYGWFKGDFFSQWLGEAIAEKTGKRNTTFAEIESLKTTHPFKSMYFMGTNLCTGFSEIFSAEKTPDTTLVDAVRVSMSIPFFFVAKRHGAREDVYVDGGMLDNYPVKMFDREQYVDTASGARRTGYYEAVNKDFLVKYPCSSPYVYNKETLGFRLDSQEEISKFRDHKEPVHHKVDGLFPFIKRVVQTYMDAQDNTHLHSDDWQRTIYVDTLGVGTTDFDLTDEKKKALLESGLCCTRSYFDWYDNAPDAANALQE